MRPVVERLDGVRRVDHLICVVLLKIISSKGSMKNAVLLSVHPEHVNSILSGKKKLGIIRKTIQTPSSL